jgi:hypothetical protein
MKRFVPLLLAGILLLIFQTTWLPFFPIQRIRPDLLLIFTLYLAFYTFSRTFVFFATQFFKERFYLEGFSFQFLFAFIFSILEGGLLLILINGLEPVSFGNLYSSLFAFLLPQSFCTGLVAPFLFFLFKKGTSLLFRQPEQGIKARG